MSATIGIINGRFEFVKSEKDREVGYMPQTMHITRFNGGTSRGTSLQINIGNQHIQLGELAANQLAEIMANWEHCDELTDY